MKNARFTCLLRICLSVALVCQAMPLSAAPCHNVMSILNHLALLQPGFTAALALLNRLSVATKVL